MSENVNKSTIITNIKDFLKEAKAESDMNKSNIIPKSNYDNFLSTKERGILSKMDIILNNLVKNS